MCPPLLAIPANKTVILLMSYDWNKVSTGKLKPALSSTSPPQKEIWFLLNVIHNIYDIIDAFPKISCNNSSTNIDTPPKLHTYVINKTIQSIHLVAHGQHGSKFLNCGHGCGSGICATVYSSLGTDGASPENNQDSPSSNDPPSKHTDGDKTNDGTSWSNGTYNN